MSIRNAHPAEYHRCFQGENNLTIDNLFSLSKSTIEYANPVKESIGELPKATLARLESDNNAMGVQMKKY